MNFLLQLHVFFTKRRPEFGAHVVSAGVGYSRNVVGSRAVIYDISGMVEASFDLSENTIYNLDGLQQGAYIVKIETGNSIITKKNDYD